MTHGRSKLSNPTRGLYGTYVCPSYVRRRHQVASLCYAWLRNSFRSTSTDGATTTRANLFGTVIRYHSPEHKAQLRLNWPITIRLQRVLPDQRFSAPLTGGRTTHGRRVPVAGPDGTVNAGPTRSALTLQSPNYSHQCKSGKISRRRRREMFSNVTYAADFAALPHSLHPATQNGGRPTARRALSCAGRQASLNGLHCCGRAMQAAEDRQAGR